MATANFLIFDALVRHQIGLRRLATQTVRDLTSILDSYDRRIKSIIDSISTDSTLRDVNSAITALQRINKTAYDVIEVNLFAAMEQMAVYEVAFQNNILAKSIGKDVFQQLSIITPPRSDITATPGTAVINGAKLTEYVAGAAAGRFNRMRDAIRKEYVVGGAGVKQGIRQAVMGRASANYQDGVLGTSRRSLDQIVRTVQSGVISEVRSLLYDLNSHVFRAVLWVSALDNKTSDICQKYDGRVFPLGKGPRPPAHYVCRSFFAPIIKHWRDLPLKDPDVETKRLLMGDVPERVTYYKWLLRQPADVQDEVLGPTRGLMLRRGEITIDRFTDDKGRRYTLDELRAREGL